MIGENKAGRIKLSRIDKIVDGFERRCLLTQKEIGITDVELTELRNRLIYKPLDQLGRAQERKLISSAEIQTLEEGSSDNSE